MTIQPIGPTISLLYLTFADLQERGLHPDFLSSENTLSLAREGLSLIGRSTVEPLELESYPDKSGLLLFIYTAPTSQNVWRFIDSDAFLDAVISLREITSASLYWWKDHFWLVSDDFPDPRLPEFADPCSHDPFLCARLAEYATPLFP